MVTETFNDSYGQRGSVTTTVNGAGTATVNVTSTPVQRAVSGTKIHTPRHKPPGWLYPQPYTRTISARDNGNGHWQMTRNPKTTSPSFTNVQDEIGCMSEYSTYLNVGNLLTFSSNSKDRAITKALLKLKDQKVNLAQAYAERQMTADLLADSLSRIANSVLSLRRGNPKEAWRWLQRNHFLTGRKGLAAARWAAKMAARKSARSLRSVPKSWLEFQYGWKPLMSDVFNSIELLQEHDELSDWVITVKAAVNEVYRNEDYLVGSYAGRRNLYQQRGVFVRLDYTPDNKFLSTLASSGVTNPLVLLWELTPYSFVVDWGLRVGDYLSSLDAALGFQFLSGSYTDRRETVTRFKAMGGKHPQDPLYKITRENYECHRRELNVQRVPFSSSPLPKYPAWKDPLSLDHVANGLSLLTQALKGGPPRVY